VNPNAGGFRRDPSLIGRLRAEVGYSSDVLITQNDGDLARAARAALGVPRRAIVLCGGDGTYLSGVTALVRAAEGKPLPPLVLARGGTVSIVARNWGGRESLLETARRVTTRPDSLRVTPRPTLAVVDDDPQSDGAKRVGFTFGTGLVARFFEEYERLGADGNRTALGIVLRTFAASLTGGAYSKRILAPLPCTIAVDGTALAPDAYSLVVSSVLRDVGLHMLVTHRGGEDPRRPHLVASPLSPSKLGPQWPRVALGKPLRGRDNFDGLVGTFTVDFGGARGRYILDGDAFPATKVTVTAGPVIPVAR
jgi:diacylglycerol kinase family enzyme